MDPVFASSSFHHLVVSYVTLPLPNILFLVYSGSVPAVVPLSFCAQPWLQNHRFVRTGCLTILSRCLAFGYYCSNVLGPLPVCHTVPQLPMVWPAEITYFLIKEGTLQGLALYSLQSLASALFKAHCQVN